MAITIVLLGKQYTTNARSRLMLAPLLELMENGGKTVDGWYGAAYCLGELLKFSPPIPEELVWFDYTITKKGEDGKRHFGINLSEAELVYVIQTLASELEAQEAREQLEQQKKANVTGLIETTQQSQTTPMLSLKDLKTVAIDPSPVPAIFADPKKEQIRQQIEKLQRQLESA